MKVTGCSDLFLIVIFRFLSQLASSTIGSPSRAALAPLTIYSRTSYGSELAFCLVIILSLFCHILLTIFRPTVGIVIPNTVPPTVNILRSKIQFDKVLLNLGIVASVAQR